MPSARIGQARIMERRVTYGWSASQQATMIPLNVTQSIIPVLLQLACVHLNVLKIVKELVDLVDGCPGACKTGLCQYPTCLARSITYRHDASRKVAVHLGSCKSTMIGQANFHPAEREKPHHRGGRTPHSEPAAGHAGWLAAAPTPSCLGPPRLTPSTPRDSPPPGSTPQRPPPLPAPSCGTAPRQPGRPP